jgi:hypothetical protein
VLRVEIEPTLLAQWDFEPRDYFFGFIQCLTTVTSEGLQDLLQAVPPHAIGAWQNAQHALH